MSRKQKVEAMLDRLRHAVADELQDGDLIVNLRWQIRQLGVSSEVGELEDLIYNGDEFVWREAR